MSINERAFNLAAGGASNAEIFAELELTPQALKGCLLRDHSLLFSIVKGRRLHIEPAIIGLVEMVQGGEEIPKRSLSAISLLIDRVDRQNNTLMLAQDLILLQGIAPSESMKPRDAATVTQLLRRRNA
jgi:hypothetical protein